MVGSGPPYSRAEPARAAGAGREGRYARPAARHGAVAAGEGAGGTSGAPVQDGDGEGSEHEPARIVAAGPERGCRSPSDLPQRASISRPRAVCRGGVASNCAPSLRRVRTAAGHRGRKAAGHGGRHQPCARAGASLPRLPAWRIGLRVQLWEGVARGRRGFGCNGSGAPGGRVCNGCGRDDASLTRPPPPGTAVAGASLALLGGLAAAGCWLCCDRSMHASRVSCP